MGFPSFVLLSFGGLEVLFVGARKCLPKYHSRPMGNRSLAGPPKIPKDPENKTGCVTREQFGRGELIFHNSQNLLHLKILTLRRHCYETKTENAKEILLRSE